MPSKHAFENACSLFVHLSGEKRVKGRGKQKATWRCKYCFKEVINDKSRLVYHFQKGPEACAELARMRKEHPSLYAGCNDLSAAPAPEAADEGNEGLASGSELGAVTEVHPGEAPRASHSQTWSREKPYVKQPSNEQAKRKRESAVIETESGHGSVGGRQLKQKTLENTTYNWERLNKAIADVVIQEGIAFHTPSKPAFKRMLAIAQEAAPQYSPPSATLLRNRLLEDRYEETWTRINEDLSLAPEHGATVMFDGYTDDQGRQLYNVLLTCGRSSKTFTVGIVDMTGTASTGENIALSVHDKLQEARVLEKRRLTMAISDNAANVKKAQEFLQSWFVGLETATCVAHGLDLFFADVGCIAEVNNEIVAVADFMRWLHSQKNLENILKEEQRKGRWSGCKHEPPGPLVPVETRFASSFAMLRRFCRIYEDLSCVVWRDDFYNAAAKKRGTVFRSAEDIVENMPGLDDEEPGERTEWLEAIARGEETEPQHAPQAQRSGPKKKTLSHKEFLEEMRDRLFSGTLKARAVLEKVKSIVRLLMPAYVLMRDVDTGKPMVPFIYHRIAACILDTELTANNGFETRVTEEATRLLNRRWNTTLHCRAHAAAYGFNPQYLRHALKHDRHVRPAVRDILRNYYKGQTQKAEQARCEWETLRDLNFGIDGEELDRLAAGDVTVAWNDLKMTGCFECLAPPAIELMCQPAAASMVEGAWSSHAHFLTRRRNRLGKDRLDMLNFTRTNWNTIRKAESEGARELREFDYDDRAEPDSVHDRESAGLYTYLAMESLEKEPPGYALPVRVDEEESERSHSANE